MKKIFKINNQNIEYTLRKHHRAKKIRLSVYGNGRIVITLPYFLSAKIAEKFITEKSDWIIEKLKHFKKSGVPVTPKNTRKEYLIHKSAALKLARLKIKHFNEFYNFKIGKVTIRNQRTRWGSCSKDGNLSFNYKIALLTEKQADYIIVHELCHLQEFNHSKKFWDLVSKTIPHHTKIRSDLRNKVF